MVCSTIACGAPEAGADERLFRFKEGLVSRHSAEKSNQANLPIMSTARLLVEERKQMLHETGRALRDQLSWIAVVGGAQWWNRPVSGQGAKAEPSHSAAHYRTLLCDSTIGLLSAADNPLRLRLNHSIACQLTLFVHCSNPSLILGKRKRLRPQHFVLASRSFRVSRRCLASASTGTHLQRRLGRCR